MRTQITLYPATEGFPVAPDYTAEVEGRSVFVYHQPGFAGGAVSWISFDFSGGPVHVRVTAQRLVDSVEVKPDHAGIPAQLSGNTASFVLPHPGQFFVKWDGDFQLPFLVFANPPESVPAPEAADADVIYFGPGVHRPGVVRPTAGQTVYLAGGAMVHGQIDAADADGVCVRGRGILCGSHIAHGEHDPHDMLCLTRCRDSRIEGITVLDGFCWTVVLRDCDDALIENVKVLAERLWSTDGINPCSSRRVTVRDCFVRSKDDCIAVKGLAWTEPRPDRWVPLRDVLVERCVFWSDNNNALVVGCETRASLIENVVFRDCDILRTSNTCGDIAGALSIICLDDTTIQDVRFEDIRLEHPSGPLVNIFFAESMFTGQIPGTKQPGGGLLRRITFDNVRVTGGTPRRSFVRGLDARHVVEDVRVRNLVIAGKTVREPADGRFVVNEWVRGLTFG